MKNILKPLRLVDDVRNAAIFTKIEADVYAPGLCRTIGSVTYSILPRRKRPRLVKFILHKTVATDVADRLVKLGLVDTLFTLEIHTNAAYIPAFTDAASLEDILVVRDSWPFEQEHSKLLAADILAGISSLHKVGLQRNRFCVSDILLVERNGAHFFQIAGLEDCTCIDNHDPGNADDRESFLDMMKYVEDRIDRSGSTWLETFISVLAASKSLDNTSLSKAICVAQNADLSRRELDMYLHAVRIFGTTLGDKSDVKRL